MKINICMFAAFALLVPSAANADEECCGRCGCKQNVRKVCRLVCEEKEEKKVVYDCECEDFCIEGKHCKIGRECKPDCTALHGCSCHDVTKPTCAKVHTRNKLIKREVVKKVPSYKWVVEYVCCQCEGKCKQPEARVGGQPEPGLTGSPVGAVEARPEPPAFGYIGGAAQGGTSLRNNR